MLRATVQVNDEVYKFEDKNHIRKTIVIHRDPTTLEFPLMELYFEKEDPKYKEPYCAYVGVGKKILDYGFFEYTDRDNKCFYEGYIDFDVNEYKISNNKDTLKVDFKY